MFRHRYRLIHFFQFHTKGGGLDGPSSRPSMNRVISCVHISGQHLCNSICIGCAASKHAHFVCLVWVSKHLHEPELRARGGTNVCLRRYFKFLTIQMNIGRGDCALRPRRSNERQVVQANVACISLSPMRRAPIASSVSTNHNNREFFSTHLNLEMSTFKISGRRVCVVPPTAALNSLCLNSSVCWAPSSLNCSACWDPC